MNVETPPQGGSCGGNYYHCSDFGTSPFQNRTETYSITQNINTSYSINIGGIPVPIRKRVRNFNITSTHKWDWNTGALAVWVGGGLGGYSPCGSMKLTLEDCSVSESYDYDATIFYYLDSRTGTAFYKTTSEQVSFSAPGYVAKFIGQWGAEYFTKYFIENHIRSITVEHCFVHNGLKTVLKTETNQYEINNANNPLKIVFPTPPPMGQFDDPDLDAGFYDYGDQQQKFNDGGDDFFFTDWMRGIGLDYRTQDQDEAWGRYFDFYLAEGESPILRAPGPHPLLISSDPYYSAAVDYLGNLMYAGRVDGDVNNIVRGFVPTVGEDNLAKLLPTQNIMYPIGLI